MKAIRPIYDGMDDLDERDWIECVDMMVCMFSRIHEGIDSMEDINAEQKEELRHKVDLEILPTGVTSSEKGINDDMYVAEAEDEYDLYNGTGFDELIVMFEITRWLKENLYEWDSAVTPKFKCIARALGICSEKKKPMISAYSRDDYVLNVEPKAFHELKLLLPLHWATILLDWYPVLINGLDNKEMIEFGNLMIVRDEAKQEMNKYDLWEKAQLLLKDRNTTLSYKTWIEPLAFQFIDEETACVYLSWPEQPGLINHINDHYLSYIESAITECGNKKYRIVIKPKSQFI